MDALRAVTHLPPAVNGLALGNVGLGVALFNIFRDNAILTRETSWIVYGLSLYGILLLALYLVRVVVNWESFLKEDCSKPQPLSAIGAHSMAVLLVAFLSATPELQLDTHIPLALAVYGSAVQLGAMLLFLYRCYNEVCWPEPFYNAAIHSCQFIVIAVPNYSSACNEFRRVVFFFGLVMLLPSLPAQIYRTLLFSSKVAQNYSVCIMQAAFSISLTAWLVFPLTESASTGRGASFSHVLFALSTATYVCTWIAIYQRRAVLWCLGHHPSIASATFPFSNSAISAIYTESP